MKNNSTARLPIHHDDQLEVLYIRRDLLKAVVSTLEHALNPLEPTKTASFAAEALQGFQGCLNHDPRYEIRVRVKRVRP